MVLTDYGLMDVPKDSVLLIEEEIGNIKSIFVEMLAKDALASGKMVYYISTKDSKENIIERLYLKTESDSSNYLTALGYFADPVTLLDMCLSRRNLCKMYTKMDMELQKIPESDLCIIDTFSSLFINQDTETLIEAISSFINISRETKTTFILTSDMGIIEERMEKIMRSMVDGIIQFRTEYNGGKINRLINIPKMKGSLPPSKMLAYHMTNQGIQVDTRERVG